MRVAHHRRLLGAGVVISWTIVVIGGALSIRYTHHERFEWLFLLALTIAATLTIVAGLVELARWIPTVMQRPTADARHRKPAGSDETLTKILAEVEKLEATAEAALHDDIPCLPPVPQEIIDTCNAPAGSPPREIRCEALGHVIGRTVTPGDDPDRVWREVYLQILDAHRRTPPWRSSTAGRM